MKKISVMKNKPADARGRLQAKERLQFAASASPGALLAALGTGENGLGKAQVEASRARYGKNVITRGKANPPVRRIAAAFVNPFTVILAALAAVSVVTDVVLAAGGEKNGVTAGIIAAMVMISGVLRFVQETRSGHAADRLQRMIRTTACAERGRQGRREIPLEEIVVGDIVRLSAGDLIPADVRILSAKDLFVSQAALTGESEPVEKRDCLCGEAHPWTDLPNLAFMGSAVISGSAKAVVLAVGDDTLFGGMARTLSRKPPKTTFDKGVDAVSRVLIRFMLVMVPVVLFLNGFTKGSWLGALLFAISVAVGLTPEMLPMIVTTNLAKGAVAMSKKKVIIKNLGAIQNLGSMDVLCTDKTGTLTQDRVVLEHCLDLQGNEDVRVLRHAFLNSWYQTGLKNLIDLAVIGRQESLGSEEIRRLYTKVDEIPFDFARRRMSVAVAGPGGKIQLVTKGAVEEMLQCCAWAELDGQTAPLTGDVRAAALARAASLNGQGMRVLAVARKTVPAPAGRFSAADEADMVLLGFLAFLDPPKPTAKSALRTLHGCGVAVKILTGDNEKVTRRIAARVGLEAGEVLLGAQLDAMTDRELGEKAERTAVFAKLSPEQKARVVRLLRERGHSVGYMGDGINDAAAMGEADVGISVDTAADIAKERADVILLEKDLNVLEDGILEGRKTYANMIKYIKMTASSNFGNMFSVLAASAFLPFLPMEALHLILLNLVYDLACTAMPWDNVDAGFLHRPCRWDAGSVGRFMLWFGPVSSVFDIAAYLVLYFVICPLACGGQTFRQIGEPARQALSIAVFQAGWFVESMWSQALVIHMIRTPRLPFVQSRASAPVTLLTLAAMAAVTAVPFTPLGAVLGFAALPAGYFAWLALIVLGYMALVTAVKKAYIGKFGALL